MSKKKHKMLLLNPDGPIQPIPEENDEEVKQVREDYRKEYNKAQSDWVELVTKVDRPELGLLVYTAWYGIDNFVEDYLEMTGNSISPELFKEYEDIWKKHSEVLKQLAKTLEEAIWWEILANEPHLLED